MNLYQLAKDDGVDRFFKQTSWLTILEPVADMFVDIRWYYEIYVPKRWWRDTDRFFKQTSWAVADSLNQHLSQSPPADF